MNIKNTPARKRSKWMCDPLEGRLQSAEEERGRLVAAIMAGVGS